MQPNAWEICKCIITGKPIPNFAEENGANNPPNMKFNMGSDYAYSVDRRMESTDSEAMEYSSGKMLGSSGRLFSVEEDIITNVNPILEDMMQDGSFDGEDDHL